MIMKRILAGGLLALAAGLAQAGELDFYLSNKSLQANYRTDTAAIGYGGGWLSFGGFHNDNGDNQLDIGLSVEGAPSSDQPFSFGLGIRGYFAFLDTPNENVQALALGGVGRFHIPAKMPMALAGRLYYAPDITSFGKADSLLDWGVDYEIEVMPSATGYVGYRKETIGLSGLPDHDLEDRFHVGVRLVF
ncbi:MAG: hypothetical protein D6717_10885 [Gammaproteobacteria bacterium]|nr:MAG: hypothetical protein D6717_10885 [Gammaproteobacteria bacterium]